MRPEAIFKSLSKGRPCVLALLLSLAIWYLFSPTPWYPRIMLLFTPFHGPLASLSDWWTWPSSWLCQVSTQALHIQFILSWGRPTESPLWTLYKVFHVKILSPQSKGTFALSRPGIFCLFFLPGCSGSVRHYHGWKWSKWSPCFLQTGERKFPVFLLNVIFSVGFTQFFFIMLEWFFCNICLPATKPWWTSQSWLHTLLCLQTTERLKD